MNTIQTAMILAAGRGERMRPLTDAIPKPLALVGGKPLIVHTIERLVNAGVQNIVINLAWRGAQLREGLGDGRALGVRIAYSDEGDQALETGGGIVKALPLLGDQPFWVVSGDIWTDYPFAQRVNRLAEADLAHLAMVPNPGFHPRGDFYLTDGRIADTVMGAHSERLTYASLGLFRPQLFVGRALAKVSMVPWMREAMAQQRVSGERYEGHWHNVGTIEQLRDLDQRLSQTLEK